MRPCMLDLVEKAQGTKGMPSMSPDKNGRYRYNNRLKTLRELSKISSIPASTLHSRFQRGTYRSVEEVVDTPLKLCRQVTTDIEYQS